MVFAIEVSFVEVANINANDNVQARTLMNHTSCRHQVCLYKVFSI